MDKKKRFKLTMWALRNVCEGCDKCVKITGVWYCCSETGEDGQCNADNKKKPP